MKKLKSILLVDDDNIANFYNQLIIEEMGITDTIVIKHNGAEALDFLQNLCFCNNPLMKDLCPEIIFLDVNMPVMNGLELLEELKKFNEEIITHTRIVILTSSNNQHDIALAQSLGVKAYLNKPLTEEKIAHLLSQ
ncbi:MAG: response regulator [Bacteroidota bacterium]